MSDMLKAFFSGIEDFAKKMKEYSVVSSALSSENKELRIQIIGLSERVDKLLNILESCLGTTIEVFPAKRKRMMDVKKRIHDIIKNNPDGIRPPEIARSLGTRVQNLYPHFKAAMLSKSIFKDKAGNYFPVQPEEKKSKKPK